MSSSSGAVSAFLNARFHCSENFALCWSMGGFPSSLVRIVAANSGPLWLPGELLALGVSIRAALVRQAPRLLRDGKHGELWGAALGAVCKIHSWVRGSSGGQSGTRRDYVNARPSAVPHMICSGKQPRSIIREVKYLKEGLNWSSRGKKCEHKCHRIVSFGRELKDHIVLISFPWAGNLSLD